MSEKRQGTQLPTATKNCHTDVKTRTQAAIDVVPRNISYPILAQSKDNTLTYATTRNHKSKQNNNDTKLNNKSNGPLYLEAKTSKDADFPQKTHNWTLTEPFPPFPSL